MRAGFLWVEPSGRPALKSSVRTERCAPSLAHVDSARGAGRIQSEISWAPWQQHPISPEYVFQIDTSAKANWMWGDNGVGYFGRGTVTGRQDEWALEWQCY